MRQIILDTETTGLEPEKGHRIIEIGCVEMVNRKFTGKTFHKYINPERDIENEAVAVHGITQDFLKDKPLFADIVHEFIEFVQGAELIIHNAPFDIGFINHELKWLKKNWKNITDYCPVTDTLAMARQIHVGQRNSLDALCKRYTIDNSHREFHGALLDSHLLGRVYLAMTGGQATLFADIETTEITIQPTKTTADSELMQHHHTLRVIKATESELQAHQDTLKGIAKKSKCLWHELESE
jgi:DNA polymerase-3 subunit epsilon